MLYPLIGIFTVFLLMPASATGFYEPSGSHASSSPAVFEFYMPASDTPPVESAHIPVILNDSVESYIEYFRSEKTTFQQGLNNAAPYLQVMKEIFRDENLPVELIYIGMIESQFNHAAVSPAQAVGPWQFMAVTGDEYSLTDDAWVDERRDPIKSTLAAARYLRDLHDRLGSWPLVLASYNAGISKVRRAMLRTGFQDFWDLKETEQLGWETKSFVPKIMAAFIIARDPRLYGFTVPRVPPLRFDVVVLHRSVDLRAVAAAVGTTYSEIKSLNPEIKGSSTPPRTFYLRLPAGAGSAFSDRASGSFREADRSLQNDTSIIMASEGGSNFPGYSSPVDRAELAVDGRHDKPVARRNYSSVLFVKTRRKRIIRGEKLQEASKDEPTENSGSAGTAA